MTKSPFPGMDPYLEAHWLDVHSSLVTDTRNALNRVLPDDLAARSEERVAVEAPDEDTEQSFHPDVGVLEIGGVGVGVIEASAALASAPVRLALKSEPATERFLTIVEAGTERLITVIEFISPSNKRGGLEEFRAKRAQLLAADVNFVEVDLVREGNWRALLRPYRCPKQDVTPYRVTIRTPDAPRLVGLYPIPLRQPLPSIVLPLRKKDPQVRLDLQPLIEQAYVNGRYARTLNYRQPPVPPLQGEEASWAAEVIGRCS